MTKVDQLTNLLTKRRQDYLVSTSNIFEHLGKNVKDAIATLCGVDPKEAEDNGSIIWIDIIRIKEEGFIITLVVAVEDIKECVVFSADEIAESKSNGATGKMIKFGITDDMLSKTTEDIIAILSEKRDDGDLVIMSMQSSYDEQHSTQTTIEEAAETKKAKDKFDFSESSLNESQKLSLRLWALMRN